MGHEITNPAVIAKLNELGRRLSVNLLRSEFYLKAEPKVQEMMRECPPFMLYRLKDNEQIVYISEYHTKKNQPDMPVVMTIDADPQYNEGLLAIHKYFGCVKEALEPVQLRAVADMEGFRLRVGQSKMKQINLANRVQAVTRARRVEGERRLEKRIWENAPKPHGIIKPGDHDK